MNKPFELNGVRLGDVYRGENGDIWEVISLCSEPQGTLRHARSGRQETHVIGCWNWRDRYPTGPLRAVEK